MSLNTPSALPVVARPIDSATIFPMHSLAEKRQALLALVARYRATNVRVFGSTARGEETAESDIDLLVDMPTDASLYDLIEMAMEIESLLGRRADVLTERGLNPHLRERILAEARPL